MPELEALGWSGGDDLRWRLLDTNYGPEIWDLYRRGALHLEVALTGRYTHETGAVDLRNVMREIHDARDEENARRLRMQAVG